jgi:peptide/nickel transport system ATP-binding protein
MKRTRVAVVGCGHLGAIHARLLAAREDVELVAIVDPVAESRERAAAAHGCRPLAEPRDLVGRLVDAIGGRSRPGVVHALDHVSLTIARGETLGLVGESGCGKSTLGRIAAGILEPGEGEVLFHGATRDSLTGPDRRAARLAVQMIFQDPMASLNPRQRAGDIVAGGPPVEGR